jgi:hypothetical protein
MQQIARRCVEPVNRELTMSQDTNPIPINPAQDADLVEVDAALTRRLRADAPTGLADRIYAASVDELNRAVDVRRRGGEGYTTTRRWRMAAAAAMLIFYAAVWFHPSDAPTRIPDAAVAQVAASAEQVHIELDADIRSVEQELVAFDQSTDELGLLPDEKSLAYELLELESQLDTEWF